MRYAANRLVLSVLILTPCLRAEERPPVTSPRATSGDEVVEPKWQERLTITVGPKDADIIGSTDRAIQAAVDYVARFGGGTVKIQPGVYRQRNAIYLASRVRLVGSGADTILRKEPSVRTTLKEDSDWYDQEITLTDASGFRVGDGICLRTRDENKRETVLRRTLVARSGDRFKLDRALRANFWRHHQASVELLCPLVTGEEISDVAIEDVVLDGNREHNANLNGNYAGCIFLQDCRRIAIRGVTARNYNGDGISFQICHDVIVENCVCENNAQLGLHPGSGSQRPIMRNNQLRGNEIGIFFCWGVKYGLAENNTIVGNAIGVSIGHHDTDNLVTKNLIEGSKRVGVLFRPERGKDFAGHRNRIVGNRLIDNAGPDGAAVDIQGGTESITLQGNEIRDSRGPSQRIGVRLGAQTQDIRLSGNTIEGFAEAVKQLR